MEPQKISQQAHAHQSAETASVSALPATAEPADVAAVGGAEASSAEQLASPGAAHTHADAPHALAEDEGVPDQAPLTASAAAQQTAVSDGAAASDKGSWRRAEEPATPAVAGTAGVFPTAELANSLEDAEAVDSGAALSSSQPQRSEPAVQQTAAGAAVGEVLVAGAAGSMAGDGAAAMVQRLQQQPNRVLDEAQVEAGISYVGHNARLRRLMRRLSRGEGITLGALITHLTCAAGLSFPSNPPAVSRRHNPDVWTAVIPCVGYEGRSFVKTAWHVI